MKNIKKMSYINQKMNLSCIRIVCYNNYVHFKLKKEAINEKKQMDYYHLSLLPLNKQHHHYNPNQSLYPNSMYPQCHNY